MSKMRPLSVNPDCNCSALRQATRCVTRLYDEALAPVGLGASQYAILTKLERFGQQSLGGLACVLVMDRSTVGHLLRPLEKRGLVTIETAASDGRKRVVALAAAGRLLAAEARPLWAAAQRQFEHRFGSDEAQTMRAILARVVAADPHRASASSREIVS